jgi:16S rRNA processing protein RimM
MNKSDCYFLGYISKPHGIKGEVNVKLDVDNPYEYSEMESVFLEVQGKLVPFFIESISIRDKGFALIKFEGIDNEAQASAMVQSQLFLPLSILPPLQGNKFYYHEVIDFKVSDKSFGEVGLVKDVLEYPHQAVLQVLKADKEILIPITDAIILNVDRQLKTIFIAAPEGLIELYL